MKSRPAKIVSAFAAFGVMAVVSLLWLEEPKGDAAHYAELCRTGALYKRLIASGPCLSDRLVALVHLTSDPANYYEQRYEKEKKALVASGYLIQVAVPVPDLAARIAQVRSNLLNTLQETGAFCAAKLYYQTIACNSSAAKRTFRSGSAR